METVVPTETPQELSKEMLGEIRSLFERGSDDSLRAYLTMKPETRRAAVQMLRKLYPDAFL
jgi:hypothetical protein